MLFLAVYITRASSDRLLYIASYIDLSEQYGIYLFDGTHGSRRNVFIAQLGNPLASLSVSLSLISISSRSIYDDDG